MALQSHSVTELKTLLSLSYECDQQMSGQSTFYIMQYLLPKWNFGARRHRSYNQNGQESPWDKEAISELYCANC